MLRYILHKEDVGTGVRGYLLSYFPADKSLSPARIRFEEYVKSNGFNPLTQEKMAVRAIK